MIPKNKIFIVIPAYNEETLISPVVQEVLKNGYNNVLVVDDGSDDATVERARSSGAQVVLHRINRGYGAATRTGMTLALKLGAEVVVTLDGDDQHEACEIDLIVRPVIEKKADVVIGVRYLDRRKMPFLTRYMNVLANIITFLLSGIYCRDTQSGFRAFSRSAAEKIEMLSSGYEFSSEVFREISRLGLKFSEVRVTARYLPHHNKKGQNFSNGLETVIKLVARSLMR